MPRDEAHARSTVRAEIESIEPLDPLECAHRERALAWLDQTADLYRREKPATPPMHLVVYCVAVDQDHVLLVDHINAALWLPSGGHVEPGEHPRVAVLREASEELGLEVSLLKEAPLFVTVTETVGATAGHTDVTLWYALAVDRHAQLRSTPGEFVEARRFAFDEVPFQRTDPHLARFVSKLRSHRRADVAPSTTKPEP